MKRSEYLSPILCIAKADISYWMIIEGQAQDHYLASQEIGFGVCKIYVDCQGLRIGS